MDSPPIIPSLITSYAHGTSTTSLLHSTVGDSLLRTVERFPDREAVAFLQDGVRKTFAQLQKDVSFFFSNYKLDVGMPRNKYIVALFAMLVFLEKAQNPTLGA